MSRNTNFGGLTSYGVPVLGESKFVTSAFGRTWFVNANATIYASPYFQMAAGSNANDGLSPQTPFLTMARAFEMIKSGDVVNFTGKIQEQLLTPVQVFDVTINGCGNTPRDPDSSPDGGQYSAAEWKAPASGGTAAQATLRVLQQGWRFTNFLMRAVDTNAACLELVRNTGAADLERDASHASVYGVRFSGAGVGIRSGATSFTEIVYNVKVKNCQFEGMTYAMRGVIEANQWEIADNFFATNTNQIIMAARNFLIKNNSIGAFTVTSSSGGIDLRGGTGLNQVCLNNLSGTYSIAGGYQVANANDNWYGNASSAGFTAADPA